MGTRRSGQRWLAATVSHQGDHTLRRQNDERKSKDMAIAASRTVRGARTQPSSGGKRRRLRPHILDSVDCPAEPSTGTRVGKCGVPPAPGAQREAALLVLESFRHDATATSASALRAASSISLSVGCTALQGPGPDAAGSAPTAGEGCAAKAAPTNTADVSTGEATAAASAATAAEPPNAASSATRRLRGQKAPGPPAQSPAGRTLESSEMSLAELRRQFQAALGGLDLLAFHRQVRSAAASAGA